MHDLLEWIRAKAGDGPPTGSVDAEDVEEEMEELADGYEAAEDTES